MVSARKAVSATVPLLKKNYGTGETGDLIIFSGKNTSCKTGSQTACPHLRRNLHQKTTVKPLLRWLP